MATTATPSKAEKRKSAREILLGTKRRTATHIIEIDGEEIEFKLTSLTSAEIDKIRGQAKPTPEQIAAGYSVNSDRFNNLCMAATITEPAFTVEEIEEIAGSITFGQYQQIWGWVNDLNMTGFNIPSSASA